jgi:hypothetical protein
VIRLITDLYERLRYQRKRQRARGSTTNNSPTIGWRILQRIGLDNLSLQYDQSRGPDGALRVEEIEIFLYRSRSAGRSGPKLPTVTRSRPRSSGESRLRSSLARLPPSFLRPLIRYFFLSHYEYENSEKDSCAHGCVGHA